MPSFSDNPYTLVHDRLWKLVDNSSPLQSLVSVGNRIQYNRNDLQPHKEAVQHADLPEIELMPTAIQFFKSDSSTTRIEATWEWMLSTGSFRANFDFLQVKFAFDAAMIAFCETGGLTDLQWKNKTFVTDLQHIGAAIGVERDAQNRTVIGIASLDSMVVTMHIRTIDLIDFNSPLEALETQGDLIIETQQGDPIEVQSGANP